MRSPRSVWLRSANEFLRRSRRSTSPDGEMSVKSAQRDRELVLLALLSCVWFKCEIGPFYTVVTRWTKVRFCHSCNLKALVRDIAAVLV